MKETRKERTSVIMKNVKEKWSEHSKTESLPLILPVTEEVNFYPQDKARTRVCYKIIYFL